MDKYAPVTFTHLLSRETINRNVRSPVVAAVYSVVHVPVCHHASRARAPAARQVMKWVMGWDEVVFGKSRANFGAGKQGAQKKGNNGQGERRFGGGGGGGRPGAKYVRAPWSRSRV